MRSRRCMTEIVDATECNQRNCRPGCQASHTGLASASCQGMMGHIDQHHNAAGLVGGINRGETLSQGRSPLDPACSCGNCRGQLHVPFKDHDCQNGGERRCFTSVAGMFASKFSHQHIGCERRCCGGLSMRRGILSGADNVMDRVRSTPKSSVFSVPGDFQRNASASGCMSHLPSVSKKGAISSSLDTTSNANFPCSRQMAPVSKKQITLYGWSLMKPKCGDCSTGCSSTPLVALGGYLTPQQSLTDFVQTARVEQRLERWKVRTVDGLEVVLMGMIDLTKSIANGFDPALVEYFLIGFPSTWIFMVLNLSSGALNVSIPGLSFPSTAASPVEELSQDKSNSLKECQELPPDANPVVPATTASLAMAPNQVASKAAFHRSSTVTASPMQDGLSDVNRSLQCELHQQQSDRVKNDLHENPPVDSSGRHLHQSSAMKKDCPHSGPEAVGVEDTGKVPEGSCQTRKSTGDCQPLRLVQDVVGDTGEGPGSSTYSQKSTVLVEIRDLAPDGVVGEDVGEVPEGSSQTRKTQVISKCLPSCVNVQGVKDSPKIAAVDKGTDVILEDLTVRVQDFPVSYRHASELGGVQVPCTPLQISRQQTRGDINLHTVDSSIREADNTPVQISMQQTRGDINLHTVDYSIREVDIDPLQQSVDTGKTLRSGRHLLRADKPIKELSVGPENELQKTKSSKRPRPQTGCDDGGRGVILSRGSSVVAVEILVSHEDAAELGVPEQVPCTPLKTWGNRLRSDGNRLVADEQPTREPKMDPVSILPSLENRRILRSGRKLPVVDKANIDPAVGPFNTVPNIRSRKRLRSHTPCADNLIREEDPDAVPVHGECEWPCSTSSDGNIEAEDLRVEKEVAAAPEMEGFDRQEDELCHGSGELSSPVMKKRHRKTRNYYKSGRRKPCPKAEQVQKSCETNGPKEEKVDIDKCHEMKETIAKPRNREEDPDAVPVHSECEEWPCSTASEGNIEAEDLREEKEVAADPEMEGFDRQEDELCHESGELSSPVMKKRHRKTRKYYKSGRRKLCPKPEQVQKTCETNGPKETKMNIDKCHEMKETIPKPRNRSNKSDKLSRSTGSVVLNQSTSWNAAQEVEGVLTGKKERHTRKSIIPPPLPSPRVADKAKVTEAFGLKKSRFGRVLVPPLAVWCNQSIKYDMDGSIIAISDGFHSKDEFSAGSYNFKLPSDKASRTLQRKFQKAADRVWSCK